MTNYEYHIDVSNDMKISPKFQETFCRQILSLYCLTIFMLEKLEGINKHQIFKNVEQSFEFKVQMTLILMYCTLEYIRRNHGAMKLKKIVVFLATLKNRRKYLE